jgi:hypothetical protein
MSVDKRTRTCNFSSFEKSFLVELTKEFPVVLTKMKDATSNAQKDKAWATISERFNANENVKKRTTEALKVCLGNLQGKAKKEDAAHKASLRKTGGGPSTPPLMSSTSTSIIELMPQVFKPICVMDSDMPGN